MHENILIFKSFCDQFVIATSKENKSIGECRHSKNIDGHFAALAGRDDSPRRNAGASRSSPTERTRGDSFT